MELTTFEWEAAVRTVYGEARGEPYEGKLGVACVIRNRVDRGMAQSVLHCVFAKAQFSCWNKDDPNYNIAAKINMHVDPMTINRHLEECKTAVNAAFSEATVDITNGATHYMTDALYQRIKNDPTRENHWAMKMITTRVIGAHRFMRNT